MPDRELEVAREAVRLAGRLCRRVRETLVTEETLAKSDRSPVTVADYASQAVVNHALRQAFPQDAIVAEEDASALRAEGNEALRAKVMQYIGEFVPGLDEADALAAIDGGGAEGGKGRFWTLDPIDGTKGYIRGDQYAVALALVEDGEVVLGALACPNLPLHPGDPSSEIGCLFMARRGAGAWACGLDSGAAEPLAVCSDADPSQAVFCESFESGHSSHDGSSRLMRELGTTRAPVRLDSQAKYALVARGQASVYLRLPTRADYQERIWDHAAGWLLVEEAGGQVTDITGQPVDFSRGRTLSANKGMVVTNGRLHEAVLTVLKAG